MQSTLQRGKFTMLEISCPNPACPGRLSKDMFGELVCSRCGIYVGDSKDYAISAVNFTVKLKERHDKVFEANY